MIDVVKDTALYFGSHLANLLSSMVHDGGPEKPGRPNGKEPSGLGFRVMKTSLALSPLITTTSCPLAVGL